MAKNPISSADFNVLYCKMSETLSAEEKVCALINSKGDLNHTQITQVLQALPTSPAKIQALQAIYKNRLARMTCENACAVIDAFPIHNDKLLALDMLKRAICDHMDPKGREMLMTAFPYQEDKGKAARILETIQDWATDRMAAGGHQGYATVGFLYAQCPPLDQHLYGSLQEQQLKKPGKGNIAIPPQAMTEVYPSMYTNHPSYAYKPPSTYAHVNKMPGPNRWPVTHDCAGAPPSYPAGAPPLGVHSGAPPSVGFPGLDC